MGRIALQNAVNLAKLNNTEVLRDAQGLPSDLWVPRDKPIEPMPMTLDSPYSYLADSILPKSSRSSKSSKSSTKSEPGTSSPRKASSGTTKSAQPPGVPGPSSARAPRPDSPSFSTHPHPAPPSRSRSGKKAMPRHVAMHSRQADEDKPPSELLEQEDPQMDAERIAEERHREHMTRIAMELRKVDLTSLKSDKSRSSSRCC